MAEKTIYSSASGDQWILIYREGASHPIVRHQPNHSFGGMASEVPMLEFLEQEPPGPQHAALRHMLAEQERQL